MIPPHGQQMPLFEADHGGQALTGEARRGPVIVCLGCGVLTAPHRSGRCDRCRAIVDAPRRARRGNRYGGQHQRQRRSWARLVAAGTVPCGRCRRLIRAGEAWDLDHLDDGREWPSHSEHNRGNTSRTNGG